MIPQIKKTSLMRQCIERAESTSARNLGGPFGAAIVDDKGNLISLASNSVIADADPTAHAEINAIRQACKHLKTHDLSGYILIATGYPCPMCMAAAIWANIQTIIVGSELDGAAGIGFRDKFMYDFIQDGCKDETILRFDKLHNCYSAVQDMYHKYQMDGHLIY